MMNHHYLHFNNFFVRQPQLMSAPLVLILYMFLNNF